MIKLNPDQYTTLESLIDKNGLAAVVEALTNICYEKADHIEETWQDYGLAKEWRSTANKLSRIESTV